MIDIDDAREVMEWVEFDQDFCTRTFGTSPCTATLAMGGGQECFNTRQTCIDPANYNRGTLTLKLYQPQSYKPLGANWLAMLRGISVSQSSINPIGADSSRSALGTRGGLTVTIQDMPDSDRVTDPYLANRISRIPTYDPEHLATFWTKWRARNPYYIGREMRYCTGLIEGGQLVDVEMRRFFITALSGPNADGKVQITARDIFSVYADKNIQIPPASKGKLLADFGTAATTFTLDPVGIGAEYDASGWMCIGSEIFAFTRSGDVVTRGAQYGESVKADHQAGDSVQQCLNIVAKNPAQIMTTVVKDIGGIDAAYLDETQWAAEQVSYMPRVYSRMIAKPEGLETCLNSMSMSMYFYPMWNDRTGKIQMRAVRPADGDTIYQVDDFAVVEADSGQVSDAVDQLATQVHVYYGQRDPLKGDEKENYAAREIFFTDEGSPDKNRTETIKTIFAKWIPRLSTVHAIDIGEKMTDRYSKIPRKFEFSAPARAIGDMWVGDFVSGNIWANVDAFGTRLPLALQVMSATVSRARDLLKFSAQEFAFDRPIRINEKSLIIGVDTRNYNVYEEFVLVYGVAPAPTDKITLIIRAGVVVGSSSTSSPSMTVDSRMDGKLEIIINGSLLGAAGDGGYVTKSTGHTQPNKNGKNGGTALKVEASSATVSITNNGRFFGGGGGGGVSGIIVSGGNAWACGGGGGMGDVAGIGGAVSPDVVPQWAGQNGSASSSGFGGYDPAVFGGAWVGNAGKGGENGNNGTDGWCSTVDNVAIFPVGIGGVAGRRIEGVANIIGVTNNAMTRGNDV